MLFNEPKLLKLRAPVAEEHKAEVSVLFNEPKLLKSEEVARHLDFPRGFSALQRAEIAEIQHAAF